MTVYDLIKQINELIDNEYFQVDKALRAAYITRRNDIQAYIKTLWEVAAIDPKKNNQTGGVAYVSKSKAVSYGRLKKLQDQIKEIGKLGYLEDLTTLENAGISIYDLQYQGFGWAYSQGYGLPLTGGVKVKLVADALSSDFYGLTMAENLKKNWGNYLTQIDGAIIRGLNQGNSYSKIAEEIARVTNSQYKNAYTVAATQAHAMQSQAFLDSVDLLKTAGEEDSGKEWLATIDSKTRPDHREMDGEKADQDGIFHLPDGSTAPAPGLTGVAKQDIHCRCTTLIILPGVEHPKNRRVGNDIVPFTTWKEKRISLSAIKTA